MAMSKQRKTSNVLNILNYDDAGNIVIKDYGQVTRYSWNGLIHGFVGPVSISSVSAAVTDTDRFLVSDGGVLKYRTGAEVLSDIGGQPAGSYVHTSRTLTINGTAYDLSADRSWTVSGNNIYNANGTLTGNRTISTVSGYTLTVNPVTRFTSQLYLDSSSDALFYFQNAGASKWRMGNAYVGAANYFQFFDAVNNEERIRWNNDRTATFTSDITLVGYTNNAVTVQATAPILKIEAIGATNETGFYLQPTGEANASIRNVSGTNILFYNGSSNYFTMLSSGQLKMSAYTSPLSITGIVAGYLAFDSSGNIITASAGGVTDGDKGDITVSGSGTTWTIDNATIGIAKLSATGTASSSTYLRGDNTWQTISASPAGTSGQIQFNSSGSFGADSNLVWDNTSKRLGIGVGSPTTSIHTAGSVTATGFFESSDARLKSDILDYSGGNLASVKAKMYTKNGRTEIGYLAQDVESIYSSAVMSDATGYKHLSYREVHTAKIAALEKEIEQLKSIINGNNLGSNSK